MASRGAGFRIDDKVALVTGAGRGIGDECAEVLSAAGAKVVVADILENEGLGKSSPESKRRAGKPSSSTSMFPIEALNLQEWRKIMSVNLDGVFLGTQQAIRVMKPGGTAGKGGSIVNMCSICATIAMYGTSAYSATKGGMLAFAKAVALECGRQQYGIRINSVLPGVIRTNLLKDSTAAFVKLGMLPNADEAAPRRCSLLCTRSGDSEKHGTSRRLCSTWPQMQAVS